MRRFDESRRRQRPIRHTAQSWMVATINCMSPPDGQLQGASPRLRDIAYVPRVGDMQYRPSMPHAGSTSDESHAIRTPRAPMNSISPLCLVFSGVQVSPKNSAGTHLSPPPTLKLPCSISITNSTSRSSNMKSFRPRASRSCRRYSLRIQGR